jgi:hypothetical protein
LGVSSPITIVFPEPLPELLGVGSEYTLDGDAALAPRDDFVHRVAAQERLVVFLKTDVQFLDLALRGFSIALEDRDAIRLAQPA